MMVFSSKKCFSQPLTEPALSTTVIDGCLPKLCGIIHVSDAVPWTWVYVPQHGFGFLFTITVLFTSTVFGTGGSGFSLFITKLFLTSTNIIPYFYWFYYAVLRHTFVVIVVTEVSFNSTFPIYAIFCPFVYLIVICVIENI